MLDSHHQKKSKDEKIALRLAEFRSLALNWLLRLMLLLSILAMLSLERAIHRWEPKLYGWGFVLLILVLTVARRFPYRLRALAFVSISVLSSVTSLPVFGMDLPAVANAMESVILATVLLGIWPGVIAIIITLSAFIAMSFAPQEILHGGILHMTRTMSSEPAVAAVGLLPPFTMATLGVAVVIQGLERAFAESLQLLETLRASEERFRSVFLASPDAMAIVQRSNGKLIDVNPGFESVLGWSQQNAVGRTIAELNVISDADRERLVHRLNNLGNFDNVELRLTARSSAVIWAEVSARLTVISGTEVAIFVVRDVTRERTLALAVRHAQKIESMGTLAAGIAHNFRNALAVVVPNIELALERSGTHAETELLDALTAAQSAVELAKDLSRLSRRETDGPLECVDTVAILHQVAGICRRTFHSRLRILVESNPARLDVRARAGQLQQLFLNLCLNARDALVERPLPSITLRVTDDAIGSLVRISVTDNGCGMAPDVLRKIGEPFFTTKGEGSGTGLGLSTAFATAREFGGRLTVESVENEGTTFTVELLRWQNDSTITQSVINTQFPLSQNRIAIVDDDATTRVTLRRQVESLGFSAEDFPSPLAALVAIERNPDMFRVLMTDLEMPEMDGAALVEQIRRVTTSLSVLVITGTPDARPVVGANAVLMKPVSTPDLVRELERCVRATENPGEVAQVTSAAKT
jgi:PAS domain S-box-containing protein